MYYYEQTTAVPNCPGGTLYTVRPGDTFYRIAGQFSISVQSLIIANPQIPDPARIVPGQIICVPAQPPPQTVCPREVDGFVYTVLPGDTLNAIAQRFNVTTAEILAVNPGITNPNLLYVGQRICVPRPSVSFPCCLLLPPLPGLNVSAPIGGSLLVQRATPGQLVLTFTAIGLADPASLGNFNAYIGSVNIPTQQATFSAVMQPTVFADQPRTWSGSRLIAENPQLPEGIASVQAFNIDSGAFGPVFLRNPVSFCHT